MSSTDQTTPPADQSGTPWWRDAVIYQIYPRSWSDSDGDGVGDLPGITARLDHLADLGVDAVWLSPFYPSPQHDAGYDVADYRDVDPLFGTLADADALLARAHDLGIRVIIDLVPNHSSHEHAWFRAALASPSGSPERARYVFREGRGPEGEEPPNNWQSNFGGPAWTRVADGQWYLHLFDHTQPDFDWTNSEVAAEFESVLRFWFDRGVDGFRIDVAHGLVKHPDLPDAPVSHELSVAATSELPMWDQPGVHEIYRSWRRIAESYAVEGEDADRVLCAEAWVTPVQALAQYVRPDELHQSFNFAFLMTPWVAPALRETIAESLEAVAAVGAAQTWVLSNHDVIRHASRLGYPQPSTRTHALQLAPGDAPPDLVTGLRRARAMTAVMLALPGCAYLYQGEELGLPEVIDLPDEARQDPTWRRSGHTLLGRDGCRVPVPWEAGRASYGFGPGDRTWLPQPEVYGDLALDRQRGVEGSTLELYRELLRLRRELGLGRGRLVWPEPDSGEDEVLHFEIHGQDEPVSVWANTGSTPVRLPAGAEMLVASAPAIEPGVLPGDTTVWAAGGRRTRSR